MNIIAIFFFMCIIFTQRLTERRKENIDMFCIKRTNTTCMSVHTRARARTHTRPHTTRKFIVESTQDRRVHVCIRSLSSAADMIDAHIRMLLPFCTLARVKGQSFRISNLHYRRGACTFDQSFIFIIFFFLFYAFPLSFFLLLLSLLLLYFFFLSHSF